MSSGSVPRSRQPMNTFPSPWLIATTPRPRFSIWRWARAGAAATTSTSPNRASRIELLTKLFLGEAVQVLLAAEEQGVAGDGGRRVDRLGQLIGGDDLELVGVLDDDARAAAGDEVDVAARGDRRGVHVVDAVHALVGVVRLAGLDVEAGEAARVAGEEVQAVARQQGAGDVRRA